MGDQVHSAPALASASDRPVISSTSTSTPQPVPVPVPDIKTKTRHHVQFSNKVDLIPSDHLNHPELNANPSLARQATFSSSSASPPAPKSKLRLATKHFTLSFNRSPSLISSKSTPSNISNHHPRSVWEHQSWEIENDAQFIPNRPIHLNILLPAITSKPSKNTLRHQHNLRLERWRIASGGKGCLKLLPSSLTPISDPLHGRLSLPTTPPQVRLSTNTAINSIPSIGEPTPRLALCQSDWEIATAHTPIASQPDHKPKLKPTAAPPAQPSQIPLLVAAATHEPPGTSSPALALPACQPAPPAKPATLRARLASLAKRLSHPSRSTASSRPEPLAPTRPPHDRLGPDVGPRLRKSPTPIHPRLLPSRLALAASSVPDLHHPDPLVAGGYLSQAADSRLSLLTTPDHSEEHPTGQRPSRVGRWQGRETLSLQPCCTECLDAAEMGSKEEHVLRFTEGAARLFKNRNWFLEDLLRERGIECAKTDAQTGAS